FGSKLDSAVGRDVDSSGKKAGSRFGGALKVGAAAALGGVAVGAAALGGFLKGSLDEAREAQKVGAQTNAVIKSTGGVAGVTAKQVSDLAGAISAKSGIDDEAIASASNLLLTFTNVRNEVGKGNDIFNQATQIATDMGVALGTDASGSAIQLGKALNDPVKGITALSRVGVSFTAQQKDQIKTLVGSGKTLQAQKIILGELNKEFGGSAAAAATSGDKAKVAFGNLQESVGTALLPIWDKMLDAFAKFAVMLTNNIGPGIAALNGYLAPAIAWVGRFFSAFSKSGGVSSALSTFQTIGQAISANFLPVLRTAATTFQTVILPAVLGFVNYLRANLLPIFTQVGQIIATRVVPIVASLARFFYGTLYPAVLRIVGAIAQQLKPVFDQLFKTIQTTVLPAVSRLLARFQQWMPTIQRVIMVVLKVVGTLLIFAAAILGKVLPPLIRFAGFLIGKVVGAIGAVIGALIRIIGWIVKVGSAVVNGIKAWVQFQLAVLRVIGNVIKFVGSIPGRITSALGSLGGLLVHAGEELIQGLINGISSKIGAIKDKMSEVTSAVKGYLPGSPVKEGPLTSWNNGGAGKRLIGMLAYGLGDTRPVDRAMNRLSSRIAVASPSLGLDVSAGLASVAGRSSRSGPVILRVGDHDMQAWFEENFDGELALL
ncbi:MAG: hypothetical protein HOQ21_01335, partial [Dermatophilaceae bacterium]|nr:hypothetical protein [Dermatophilaceae bacterium]